MFIETGGQEENTQAGAPMPCDKNRAIIILHKRRDTEYKLLCTPKVICELVESLWLDSVTFLLSRAFFFQCKIDHINPAFVIVNATSIKPSIMTVFV